VVQINGEGRRVEFEARQGKQPDQWQLDFKPLLIDPGKNRIEVAVKDEQAQSAEKELIVEVEKRFEPPPEIVVLSAHDHPVLPDSPVAVEAVVRSSSPIRDLKVETGAGDGSGELLHSVADLEDRQTKNEQGQYEYHLKTSLPSGADPKLWRIEAVNRGGRKTFDIPTTVIIPPASVFLETVALRSQPKRTYPLTKNASGQLVLNQDLSESELILSGYVLAPRGKAAESRKVPVQVWVNGFLQRPTFAEPVKGAGVRWPFQAEIVLSQRRGNQIELDIVDPDLPSDASNRTTLALDCAKPNTTRKLHLLIVAVGAKREEGAQVLERAVAAVQGRTKNAREFSTPAFEQGVIHGVLLGNTVQRNKVLFEIGRLARNLRTNDVAMIYYQGDVREADETFYLATSATKALADPKQTEIGRDELNKWFGSIQGAQLILLDVDRSALSQQAALARQNVKARWPAESKIAFFRFSWAVPERAATADEPVLLTAWEVAGQKGSTLNQIDTGLETFSETQTKRYPAGITYDRHVPAMLGRVEFAPTAAGP
jgi:hypothetical protein